MDEAKEKEKGIKFVTRGSGDTTKGVQNMSIKMHLLKSHVVRPSKKSVDEKKN